MTPTKTASATDDASPPADPASVSIVISNHNYGRFVGSAIESALAQDHAIVEVIVVDDGSTDDSWTVISSFRDRVIAVRSPNEGQGHAINAGFALSTGDIVIFLDADDRLHPWAARTVAGIFSAAPLMARVQMPLEVIDADARPTGESMPPHGRALFSGDARERLLSCPDDIPWQPTSGNAFARHALEQVLPMDPAPYRLCADYHLSTLTPLFGPVITVAEACGQYRIHGSNGHVRRVTLERVRSDISRTLTTRRTLIDETRRLGLSGLPDEPCAIRSLSHAALRSLSWRLAPNLHPVPSDTRAALARLALGSARARRDLGVARRTLALIGIVTLLTAPPSVVRRLASRLLGAPLEG
jgi:hypothetical protein